MLDTTLETATIADEAAVAVSAEGPDEILEEEELAEEVIVEISVDGMCGVY